MKRLVVVGLLVVGLIWASAAFSGELESFTANLKKYCPHIRVPVVKEGDQIRAADPQRDFGYSAFEVRDQVARMVKEWYDNDRVFENLPINWKGPKYVHIWANIKRPHGNGLMVLGDAMKNVSPDAGFLSIPKNFKKELRLNTDYNMICQFVKITKANTIVGQVRYVATLKLIDAVSSDTGRSAFYYLGNHAANFPGMTYTVKEIKSEETKEKERKLAEEKARKEQEERERQAESRYNNMMKAHIEKRAALMNRMQSKKQWTVPELRVLVKEIEALKLELRAEIMPIAPDSEIQKLKGLSNDYAQAADSLTAKANAAAKRNQGGGFLRKFRSR